MGDKEIPRISGTLRAKCLQIPEVIWQAKGIVIMGRRIKSVLFSTDIAIIRNCNADAVLAVYPFTPQQIIAQTIITASSIPVLCGVGGGMTNGVRSALIAKDAEAQGAFGIVVNAPMSNDNIKLIDKVIDIPIIATVINKNVDIEKRLEAGVNILNVSAGSKTIEIIKWIRESYPKIPIIATGGPNEDSIRATIEAGANTISYTPPSTAEIFGKIMDSYRAEKHDEKVLEEENIDLITMLELV